jgi:hypothetical protein
MCGKSVNRVRDPPLLTRLPGRVPFSSRGRLGVMSWRCRVTSPRCCLMFWRCRMLSWRWCLMFWRCRVADGGAWLLSHQRSSARNASSWSHPLSSGVRLPIQQAAQHGPGGFGSAGLAIGRGGVSRLLTSHTTGHTGPDHAGSIALTQWRRRQPRNADRVQERHGQRLLRHMASHPHRSVAGQSTRDPIVEPKVIGPRPTRPTPSPTAPASSSDHADEPAGTGRQDTSPPQTLAATRPPLERLPTTPVHSPGETTTPSAAAPGLARTP